MNTLSDIKQLVEKGTLNKLEIETVLNYLIKTTRNSLHIDADSVKCRESSLFLKELCDRVNIPYVPFANNELGMKELEHHYGIVGFNTEVGQICFLLDATYMQFNRNTYPVSDKMVVSPGKSVGEKLKQQLINKGYFTVTHKNITEYLNGFIESYNSLYEIDSNLVFDKFYKELEKFNINIIDIDYLNNNTKQR